MGKRYSAEVLMAFFFLIFFQIKFFSVPDCDLEQENWGI